MDHVRITNQKKKTELLWACSHINKLKILSFQAEKSAVQTRMKNLKFMLKYKLETQLTDYTERMFRLPSWLTLI